MCLSRSSLGRVEKWPAIILVNSRLNSRTEIFFLIDFTLDFLAKIYSKCLLSSFY
jgi:hypothetical protein